MGFHRNENNRDGSWTGEDIDYMEEEVYGIALGDVFEEPNRFLTREWKPKVSTNISTEATLPPMVRGGSASSNMDRGIIQ